MDSWFRYLDSSLDAMVVQSNLKFFAEVCHCTAADPYTYSDQVLEFVAEARALQASEKSTLSSDSSLLQQHNVNR